MHGYSCSRANPRDLPAAKKKFKALCALFPYLQLKASLHVMLKNQTQYLFMIKDDVIMTCD